MRESNRVYGKRTVPKSQKAPRIKYLLLVEGVETELIYFDMINGNRTKLGISPLISLVPIERTGNENGWSNPKKLLDEFLSNLEEAETKQIKYSTLINAVIDCLFYSEWLKKRGIYIKDFKDLLNYYFSDTLQVSENDIVDDIDKTIENMVSFFKKEYQKICGLIVEHIKDTIEEQYITYDKNLDKICLVVDRDSKSFTEEQYDYVLQKCVDTGIDFFVTNPCFEFWLLLHTDYVFKLDADKIKENKPVAPSKSARNFVEEQVKNLLGGSYQKSRYNAIFFIDKIDVAVNNARKFSTDINELKNNIGSNLGNLILSLKQKSQTEI